MQGILLAPPVILALAMGLIASGSKRAWALALLAIAAAQSTIVLFVVPMAEIPGALIFNVLTPWLLVGGYLALSPYPRRPILVAVFVPFVYAGALAMSVVVGVNLGMLRL